jgi:hypothetical protein
MGRDGTMTTKGIDTLCVHAAHSVHPADPGGESLE